MIELGVAVGLALYLGMVLYRCAFRVEEGHLAVLTSFGRVEREKDRLRTFGPGLHFKMPWQRAHTVSMKEQDIDLNKDEGGGNAMADDGTILRLDSFLRYAVVEKELYAYLFELERPLEHIRGVFTCLLRNEIANFRPQADDGSSIAPPPPSRRFDFGREAGSYALIRRERKLLNERITRFCQDRIDDRYGVRFNAVDLADILPPDELADALNAVIQAQSEAEARLFRAEGECQQRILAAERGVSIASTRAAAVAEEITKLGDFLGELERAKVLDAYVARRRDEVLSESRTMFLKDGAR